jgi:HEAT repeat protein/beta-lactamase regulating signal transducer with metallopeptidase domain
MNALDSTFCTQLVVTLGHFLWQGAVLALLAAIAGFCMRRGTARARADVYTALLLLMALCPVMTFFGPKHYIPGMPQMSPQSRQQAGIVISPETVGITPERMEQFPGIIESKSVHGTATPILPLAEPEVIAEPTVMQTAVEPIRVTAPEYHQPIAATTSIAGYLTLAYTLGVCAMLLRLGFGLAGGKRLRRQAAPLEDPALLKAAARFAKQLGLRTAPVVAYCQTVAVPTVIGVLRPIILLPTSIATGLTTPQIELLLVHELAHIRRYDHLVNILQRLIEALLFFHPAVWYVSRKLRLEREHACDDLVVSLSGEPRAYAESLVATAAFAVEGNLTLSPDALAATGKPSHLRRRIQRLLGEPTPPVRLLGGTWILGAVVGLALIAGAAQVISDPPTDGAPAASIASVDEDPLVTPDIAVSDSAPPVSEPDYEALSVPVLAPLDEEPQPVPDDRLPKPIPATSEPEPELQPLPFDAIEPGIVEAPPIASEPVVPGIDVPSPTASTGQPEGVDETLPTPSPDVGETWTNFEPTTAASRRDPLMDSPKHYVQLNHRELYVQLADEDWWLRKVAVQQLMDVENMDGRVHELIKMLKDKDHRVQAAAAKGLGETGDPKAIKHLVAALKGEDSLPVAAAKALTHFTPEQVMPLLTLALQDEDESVFKGATLALGKQSTPEAASLLVSLLPDLANEDLIRTVRRAPTRRTTASARPSIPGGGGGSFGERVNLQDRGVQISKALAAMDPAISMSALKQASRQGTWESRMMTALVIERSLIQNPDAKQLIFSFLQDPQTDVRAAALWACVALAENLREHNSPLPDSVIAVVTPLLHDPNRGVAYVAHRTLATANWLPDSPERLAWYWVAGDRGDSAASEGAVALEPLLFALRADNRPAFTRYTAGFSRARIIVGLNRLNDPRTIPPLIDMFPAFSGNETQAAVDLLLEQPDPRALDTLVTLLNHAELGFHAVVALGKIQDPRAVEPLLVKLNSGQEDHQHMTIEALTEIGDPRAAEGVRPFLNSPHGNVQDRAAHALGVFKDTASADPLSEIALDANQRQNLRVYCVVALGQIAGPISLETLSQILSRDQDGHVRATAAEALGTLGDPAAIATLRDAVFFDSNANAAALAAIGSIGGQEGVDTLRELFDARIPGGNSFIQTMPKELIDALAAIEGPAAADLLAEVWVKLPEGPPGRGVSPRLLLARTLANRGDPRAEAMLEELRGNPNTRIEATNTLDKLQSGEPVLDESEQPGANQETRRPTSRRPARPEPVRRAPAS